MSCSECSHCRTVAAVETLAATMGIKVYLTAGGPSVSDPMGEIRWLFGFRGKDGSGLVVRVTEAGRVEVV